MKYIYIILGLTIFCQSCGDRKTQNFSNNVKIFEQTQYSEYTLLYGIKARDTLAFIIKTQLLNNCNSKAEYINNYSLKRINTLKTKNGTLCFEYSLPDVNNRLSITTSLNSPEVKSNCIYTYSGLPYYVDNCKFLR